MVSALPINTGNTVDVRRLLDEKIFDVIEESGYKENTFWGNVKLVIMALACGIAVFAQFNPWEFPDNRWVLGLCCLAYAALSVLLQVIMTVVDQDFVIFCHTKEEQSAKAIGVGVRADLANFDHNYHLIIETLHRKDGPKDQAPFARIELAPEKMSIGNYFDTNGYFYDDDFAQEVKKLLREFEAKFVETKALTATAETKKDR
jgi:hypothetical protein